MSTNFMWLAAMALLATTTVRAAAELSLDDYLAQVRGDNKGVKSAQLLQSGAADFSNEASLLLTPTLFGDFHYLDDRKPTVNPSFQGDRTVWHSYQLGVSQLTSFGLEGKLSYNILQTEIFGLTPIVFNGVTFGVQQTRFFEARPMLELTQSLWRNGFGAATRAEQALHEAQALSVQYNQGYAIKLQLAQAESTYWRLALAREMVAVTTESVARAVKIRDWAGRRERLQLGDKSDRLQASAALEIRKLGFAHLWSHSIDSLQILSINRGYHYCSPGCRESTLGRVGEHYVFKWLILFKRFGGTG
jgi:hypothetical protein